MNQADFSKRLGIGQSTLAMMEVGKRTILDRHIKTICSLFHVDEHWFRTGEGSATVLFTKNLSNTLDELSEQYHLSEYGRKAIESYLNMDETQRAIIDNYLKTFASFLAPTLEGETPSSPNKDGDEKITNVQKHPTN